MCVPIADDADDEEFVDDDSDKREDATTNADPLMLWRQCLRTPCGVVDPDRERDDVRLRYGYSDDDDDDDRAYVAVGPWQRRRRRGQCVTTMGDDNDDDDYGSPMTVWPSAVRHCLPNGIDGDKRVPLHKQRRRRRGEVCGRLLVTLDPARLRRGTRVSAVCHSLRRLLARAWVRDEDDQLDGKDEAVEDRRNRVYVMCEAATAADNQPDNDDRTGGSNRRRRRRRVSIRVSVVRKRHYTHAIRG